MDIHSVDRAALLVTLMYVLENEMGFSSDNEIITAINDEVWCLRNGYQYPGEHTFSSLTTFDLCDELFAVPNERIKTRMLVLISAKRQILNSALKVSDKA